MDRRNNGTISGDEIRELLRLTGESREALADECGCTRNTVDRWISGHISHPKPSIASFLNDKLLQARLAHARKLAAEASAALRLVPAKEKSRILQEVFA